MPSMMASGVPLAVKVAGFGVLVEIGASTTRYGECETKNPCVSCT